MILDFPPFFILIFCGLLGLLFGSFVTMASYRIPRNEDLVFKPSRCTSCGHQLGVLDLFPLFSWLCSKGRCRYCHAAIKVRYPLTELFVALGFILVFHIYGLHIDTLIMWGVVVCLAIMIVVDLEHKIIPDMIQIWLVILGVIYGYLVGKPFLHMFGGAFFGLCVALALRWGFWLWKRKEGLGLGDVKFFAVVGLFLEPELFVPFLLFSGLLGITTALIWQRLGKGEEFPFGPAIAISFFICAAMPDYALLVFNIID